MKSYSRISFEDRIVIAIYLEQKFSKSQIAKKLNRSRSSISREIARCDVMVYYNPGCADAEANYAYCVRRSGPRKLDRNSRLRDEVIGGLRRHWSPV